MREAAPLVAFEVPASFGPQPFSFRDPGRSPLWRFFAHVLIRLLVIAPLPPQLQAVAVLLPVSILWPLVRPAEAQAAAPDSNNPDSSQAPKLAISLLSERLGGASGKCPNRTGVERIVAFADRKAKIRIVSARQVTRRERRAYEESR
jgi:hypothetical protein